MSAPDRKLWFRAVLLTGFVYAFIGIVFAAFARWNAFDLGSLAWNRLAFLASGIAFAVHIAYEHFRLGNSPRTTAWHTSSAVALGAFGLALAANIHELGLASGYRSRILIALFAWPLLTGVPALIVALLIASLLNLRRRSSSSPGRQ